MKPLIGVMEAGGGKDVSPHVSVNVDFNGSDKAKNESPVCMMHDDETESWCQFFRVTVYEVCEFLLLLLLNCCCRTPLAGHSSLRSEILIGGSFLAFAAFFFSLSAKQTFFLSLIFLFWVDPLQPETVHIMLYVNVTARMGWPHFFFFFFAHATPPAKLVLFKSYPRKKRENERFIKKVMGHLQRISSWSPDRDDLVFISSHAGNLTNEGRFIPELRSVASLQDNALRCQGVGNAVGPN